MIRHWTGYLLQLANLSGREIIITYYYVACLTRETYEQHYVLRHNFAERSQTTSLALLLFVISMAYPSGAARTGRSLLPIDPKPETASSCPWRRRGELFNDLAVGFPFMSADSSSRQIFTGTHV